MNSEAFACKSMPNARSSMPQLIQPVRCTLNLTSLFDMRFLSLVLCGMVGASMALETATTTNDMNTNAVPINSNNAEYMPSEHDVRALLQYARDSYAASPNADVNANLNTESINRPLTEKDIADFRYSPSDVTKIKDELAKLIEADREHHIFNTNANDVEDGPTLDETNKFINGLNTNFTTAAGERMTDNEFETAYPFWGRRFGGGFGFGGFGRRFGGWGGGFGRRWGGLGFGRRWGGWGGLGWGGLGWGGLGWGGYGLGYPGYGYGYGYGYPGVVIVV